MNRYINKSYIWYIFYLLVVLPIFIFRDFTLNNELRYLSIADEALQNGSVFTFTNHGLIYADKPPLYLWIIMLGKLILGYHSMLFLGIFSFLPALVVVYVMDKWVKNILPENKRLIGQLMLLTSGFFIGSAIVLRMDMLMCMFIVLALYTFFRIYSGEGGKLHDSILFPIFVFMAIFTKGPMGLIVPLVSTTVFLYLKKDLKTIGRYWGWKSLLILIALCGVWFAGVYAEGGSQYLNDLLFNQTVNRAVDSFHHKESFYYYLGAIWYSLAPWSLLLIGILAVGLKRRLAMTDLELFFLVITLSTLVELSLFSSKLAIYMLPVFPFLVYMCVLWIAKIGSSKWMLIFVGIPACLICLALPGVFLLHYITPIKGLIFSPFLPLVALILSVSGIMSVRYLIKNHLSFGITTLSLGILLAVFTAGFSIPNYNSMIGLGELCKQAKNFANQKGGVNYYYCEMSRADNLDVYLGKKLEKLKIKDLYKGNKIQNPAILFIKYKTIERNDSLQQYLKGKNIYQVGNYCYVEIEK